MEDLAIRMVERKADVNPQTKGNKTTALMMAAHHKLVKLAKVLVANGASLETRDAYARTALDFAKSDQIRAILSMSGSPP